MLSNKNRFCSSIGIVILMGILIISFGCSKEKSRDLVVAIITGDSTKTSTLLQDGVNANDLVVISDKDHLLQKLMLMGISKKEYEADEKVQKTLVIYSFVDEIELTPLMAAVRMGKKDIVQLFLKKEKTDVNVKNSDGENALMLASYNGKSDIAEMLLDHGANINSQTKQGETVLMFAIFGKHPETAQMLINRGADLQKKTFRTQVYDGSNALIMAAESGQAEIVRLLLEKGADVNSQSDAFGETALMKCVKKLIDRHPCSLLDDFSHFGLMVEPLDSGWWESLNDNCPDLFNLFCVIKTLRNFEADIDTKTLSGKNVTDILNENPKENIVKEFIELPLATINSIQMNRTAKIEEENGVERIQKKDIPKIIKMVEPDCPSLAKKARIQGDINLEVSIDIYGRVVGLKVLSGHPLLNNAAEHAVKKWVFEPYILNGVPKPATFNIIVNVK
jgi:TonB family protein